MPVSIWRFALIVLVAAGCHTTGTSPSMTWSSTGMSTAPRTPRYLTIAHFFHGQWIDDLNTKIYAELIAHHDLKRLQSCGEAPKSCDFALGFEQAYKDIAFGKRPCMPRVPPKQYYSNFFRTPAGAPAVEAWFAGYAAGLSHGATSPVNQANQILVNAPQTENCPSPECAANTGAGPWPEILSSKNSTSAQFAGQAPSGQTQATQVRTKHSDERPGSTASAGPSSGNVYEPSIQQQPKTYGNYRNQPPVNRDSAIQPASASQPEPARPGTLTHGGTPKHAIYQQYSGMPNDRRLLTHAHQQQEAAPSP